MHFRILTVLLLILAMDAMAENNASSTTYGKELQIVGKLDIGPCMDAAVCGNRAYFIGQEKLYLADISEPAHPRITGTLAGLGNTRQIVVARDVAYVSSRADGLFVISVKDSTAPKLLCHYDSIEWATGLAISGDILFIACRNFGVELVDISNPQKPRHLSTVRTGEAQSVVARNEWLYSGVWGTSEIVVTDIHNPRRPHITSRVPLDGYGDGVDVRGNFLYAATGHHSRAPHKTDNDPGFGCGHGLEIFDISDPAKPVFVSRVKFPKLYQLGNDMWGVTISGKYAFVADTYNGIFVVDVSDPRKPFFVAHRQLPLFNSGKLPRIRPNGEIEPLKQQPSGSSQNLPGFVGGLALAQNYIYAAGGWTDLHIIAAPDLACPPTVEINTPPLIPPLQAEKEQGYRRYRPDGQVYAVGSLGDSGVAACGISGIHVIQIWPKIKPLATYSTDDFATDICVLNNMVFVAEGTAGLSIWETSPAGELKITGRYHVKGQRVRHVVVPPPGKYALVQVGEGTLHIVDISNPTLPKFVLKDSHLGLLYGNQIMNGSIDNRYAAVFWHASGLYWYDLYGGSTPVYTGQIHENRFNPQNGVTVFKNQVLTTRRSGYVVFDRQEKRSLDELPLYRIKNHPLAGKTTIFQNRLYTANRDGGNVNVVDISNPSSPQLLESFVTEGNPGRIIANQKGFIVPDGYNGLLVYDRTR
ncbi:MAG: hypothetical protein PHR77_13510 [Kiritimatiellae bacterium]|nr:hypothetical protein [Kiritimatiellia bacterium]MDD5521649.1 hypothetical protein [Kiritimatiellia bacterium]